ncbi:MAG: helix-turn-helix transcriptional regulator [Hyphomonadaceae bacterium]|nr:helix-turn-helix transcriptional regulator [Hyphomonadaceae bacterium]
MAERPEEANAKLEQELRRGVIVLATLSQLREAQYGYSLRQALAEQGMVVEEGTLYPLLRRLEGQGLLASEWRIEDGPPRRYYTLSDEGKKLYAGLTASWRNLVDTIDRLIGPPAAGEDQSRKRKAAP